MVPFASYDVHTIIWNLMEIGAIHDGDYPHIAEVDPSTLESLSAISGPIHCPVVLQIRANFVIDFCYYAADLISDT